MQLSITPNQSTMTKRLGQAANKNVVKNGSRRSRRPKKISNRVRRPRRKVNFNMGKIAHTNVLNTVPSLFNATNSKTVFKCSEVVAQGSLESTSTFGVIDIRPATFQRILTYCSLFENFRLDKLRFDMLPVNGTSIAGNFVHVIDYNRSDAATFYDYDQLLSMNGSAAKAIWQTTSVSFRPQDAGDLEFGMADTNALTFRPDSKGYLYRWAAEIPMDLAQPTLYFKILATYQVTFVKTRAVPATVASASLARMSSKRSVLPLESSHMNIEKEDLPPSQ